MRNRIKNVGILSAFCVVVLLVAVLSGCNSNSGGVLLAAEVHNNGSATTATVAGVQDKTTPITDATVTVNTTTLGLFFIVYLGTVTPTVAVGQDVTVHFASKDLDVTSTLKMPDVPTTVATTAASPLPPSTTLPLTWNLPAGTYGNIVVSVSSLYTVSSDGFTATLPAGTASYTIPANTFQAHAGPCL